MKDLIINDIDYNRELNILSEYMERIIIPYLPSGIKIDVSALPSNFDVIELIRIFKQTGLILHKEDTIPFTNPVENINSFESFKKDFLEQVSNNGW